MKKSASKTRKPAKKTKTVAKKKVAKKATAARKASANPAKKAVAARKAVAKPKAGSKAASKTPATEPFNTLQQYLSFMDEHALSELEYTVPKLSIRLKRASATASVGAQPIAAPVAPAAQSTVEEPAVPEPASSTPAQVVKSPFVGTFYRAPGPNQEPFVEEGRVVGQGEVLCIVEAMKLMNEIEADVKGRVTKILVKDATPVEFGEPLFEIEPV